MSDGLLLKPVHADAPVDARAKLGAVFRQADQREAIIPSARGSANRDATPERCRPPRNRGTFDRNVKSYIKRRKIAQFHQKFLYGNLNKV